MNEFTSEQIEIIRKELSLDNINSKYNRFMCKLQDKFDPLQVGKRVLPANVLYLEELLKLIKSLKPIGNGFVIEVPEGGPYRTYRIRFYDDILEDDIDVIILSHTSIKHYKYGESTIEVDFNGIFKEIDKSVKAFLKLLDKKKKDE